MFRTIFFLVLATLVCLSVARPQDYDDDQNSDASNHESLGRVQIKVYRGATEHDGHHHFAPWGYWVKQPADDGPHH